MRRYRLPVVLMLFLGCIYDTGAQTLHQFGLNSTEFVKQFITPNNTSAVSNNPYLIQYRLFRKKINYRAGVGGKYSFLNEDNEASRFTRNTDEWNISGRLGVDFVKQLSKHWFIYYGLDAITFKSKMIQTTNPKGSGTFIQKTEVTRTSKFWGGATNFTVEFRINNKITLFTETNLRFTRSRTYEKVVNPDFPNSATESKTRSGLAEFRAPINLFFSIIL